MREFKVLKNEATHRLEAVLNEYAKQGWEVLTVLPGLPGRVTVVLFNNYGQEIVPSSVAAKIKRGRPKKEKVVEE